jgi:hypothetical protein
MRWRILMFGLLRTAPIVALLLTLVGSVWVGILIGKYETRLQTGRLVASSVLTHTKCDKHYTAEEIYSYAIEKNGETQYANCTWTSADYDDASAARKSAKGDKIGASQSVRLSRASSDNSCLTKEESDTQYYAIAGIFAAAVACLSAYCCCPVWCYFERGPEYRAPGHYVRYVPIN